MEVVTKRFGVVRFPEEILMGGESAFYETTEERLESFYSNLSKVLVLKERDYIDYMMTWEDTLQGHDFWRDACREDYTWSQFMETEAYALLVGARERMFHIEVWSPERVKELL
jgi:hypothetical protein